MSETNWDNTNIFVGDPPGTVGYGHSGPCGSACHCQDFGPTAVALKVSGQTRSAGDAARDRLYYNSKRNCAEACELMRLKNIDYAHGDDPYRNFRMFGGLGFLVRLSDKVARLRSFEERGKFSVGDEGLKDTVQDIINYANLYHSFKIEEASHEDDQEGGAARDTVPLHAVRDRETSQMGPAEGTLRS